MLENCVRDPAHSPSKLEGVVEDRGRLLFSLTVTDSFFVDRRPSNEVDTAVSEKIFTNYSLLINNQLTAYC